MGDDDVKATLVLAAGLLFLAAADVSARGREPCSGKKGGISHCLGSYFVCKDGSTSQSKRICTASSGVSPDDEPKHGAGGTRRVRR